MYLFGASGHGKVIAEIAESLGVNIEGFIDDNENIITSLGYKVYHRFPENVKELILSIGNNKIRKEIYLKNKEFHYPVLIHPVSSISTRAKIGLGSVVMAGVSVNSESVIGSQCIVNTNASIDHDCILGDYVHISPNAALAGGVSIGEGAHIGIGASVVQRIKIGKWAVVGAGAVVIKDVPDFAVVVGNPAKIINSNN